jgi:peptidylprolyl isomerase
MKLSVGLSAAILAAAFSPAVMAKPKPAPVPLAPSAADWRPADAENTLVIDTNQGRIIAELSPTLAPASVARIKQLTRAHFYDGLTFFRVIDAFMAQTGDPKNTGEGQSTLPNLPPEFTFRRTPATPFVPLSHPAGVDVGFIGAMPIHSQTIAMAPLMADGAVPAYGMFCPGVLGMARANAPDSGNSQFFLMRQANDHLNAQYTAFGRVVVGLGVVRQIKAGEPVPAPQDRMTKVQVLADMPAATRPKVRVIDTNGAYFKALIADAFAGQGDDARACDIEVAGEAK